MDQRVSTQLGAIAQLGERNTGSVEVSGSIPLSSTILRSRAYEKSSALFLWSLTVRVTGMGHLYAEQLPKIVVIRPIFLSIRVRSQPRGLSSSLFYRYLGYTRFNNMAEGCSSYSRSGYTGEDGFEVSIPAAQAETVVRELLAQQ